jgi:hypothetical protein
MAKYESILPLIRQQSYIAKAFPFPPWDDICTGSPYGDQPWEAPVEHLGYDVVHHLTYKFHPHEPLIDAIARGAGVVLQSPVLPFIERAFAKAPPHHGGIAYAFNTDMPRNKQEFLEALKLRLDFKLSGLAVHRHLFFLDVGHLPWEKATEKIYEAELFVGCRSANYVLARGLGKPVLVYEPNSSRRPATFGCPYGEERMPPLGLIDDFVAYACAILGI